MTTVAWDGRVLAADTLGCWDGLKVYQTKVFRLSDGSLCGCVGARQTTRQAIDWIAENVGQPPMPGPSWTNGPPTWCHGAAVLRVLPTGDLWLYDEHGPSELPRGPMAMGSGRDYALAAMHCGRTAEQAVGVAERFDAGTGGPIDCLRLVTPAPALLDPSWELA